MNETNNNPSNNNGTDIKPFIRLLCILIGFGVANYLFFWHVVPWYMANPGNQDRDLGLLPAVCFVATQFIGLCVGEFLSKAACRE